MKAIDLVRWSLEMTGKSVGRITQGMGEHALTPCSAGSPHHTAWILGHLCVIEGAMPSILRGEPNPVADWEPLFGTGSRPRADGAGYPAFDVLLATFRRLRAENLDLLEEIGEDDLDRPPQAVPPAFDGIMTSAGHTLTLLALHTMVHYGQVADARRAAGLPPLL